MARDFNGSTDRIDWSAVANLTGSPLTISAWIDADSLSGTDYILCIHDSGDTAFGIVFYRHTANDRLAFLRNGSTDLIRDFDVNGDLNGAWHHVLVTHDGTMTDYTTIKCYVDGTETGYLAGGSANGASETTHSGSWSVGGRIYDDSRNFDGRIGEVAVWNAVLDSTTISALADGNSPAFYTTNLQFYWKGKADSLVADPGGTGTNDGSDDYTTSYPAITYPSSNAGAVTPAGVLINAARKILAGALTSAGELLTQFTGGGGNEYEQAVEGELTPSGSLVNSARKILAGALTSAGTVLKQAGKIVAGEVAPTTGGLFSKTGLSSLSGDLTSSGDVTKLTGKPLTGELTSSGVLVNSAKKVLDGALTSAGTLANSVSKTLSGALTSAGVVVKQTAKALVGELTSSGAVETIKAALLAIGGALTMAGNVVMRTGKVVAGTITPDGGLIKSIRTALAGALTPVGNLAAALAGAGGGFIQSLFKGIRRSLPKGFYKE